VTVSDDCSQAVLTDESANLARHSSTHAAITHPRRVVAIQVYLGQHVEKMHAWSLGSDVPGTAPASVGAASRTVANQLSGETLGRARHREPRQPRSIVANF
jgi:hypothetical protein